jgi:hypothetical protein
MLMIYMLMIYMIFMTQLEPYWTVLDNNNDNHEQRDVQNR